MRFIEDITVEMNVKLLMRERGKLVPGSIREGHNVFTTNGKNWLSKLMAWQTVGGVDTAYTNRRARWMGVGSGSQVESAGVTTLVAPLLATATDFLRPIQSSDFPTSTSVQFTKEFGSSEITIAGTPVEVTEVGLYADVSPGTNEAVEDASYDPENPLATILYPASPANPLIAYKTFEVLTKTVDFSLTICWELRFAGVD